MRLVHIPLGGPPELVQLQPGRVEWPEIRRYQTQGNWWLHLYRYHARLEVDGVPVEVAPGTASLIPPGCAVAYHWQRPGNLHLYAHLRCGFAGPAPNLPLLMPLGTASNRLWTMMDEAIALRPLAPAAARARMWDLLWRISDVATAAGGGGDPLVAAAIARVTAAAGPEHTATAIASRLGVSIDTLDRRFRAATGMSLAGWQRRQLAERIRSMLLDEGMDPAQAARELGWSDLQAFNKVVRRLHGVSPRRLRAGG